MDDGPSQFLALEVVYRDEHMIELAASFSFAEWTAYSKAYTQPECVCEFVDELEQFARRLSGEASFAAGLTGRAGFLFLKFYTVGGSRSLFCNFEMIAEPLEPLEPREGSILSKVSVELPFEAAALDTFVAALRRIAETQLGKAALRVS